MAYHVLTVSSHFAVTEGLRSALLRDGSANYVDSARTGAEATTAIARTRPDIVIVDKPLSDLSCADLTARAQAVDPSIQVIVVGRLLTATAIRRLRDAGVAAIVAPSASVETLQCAVAAALDAGVYIDPRLGAILGRNEREPTTRELEVLELLVEGLQNKVIAHALGISLETVKSHIRVLMRKLDAGSRTELVVHALQRSLVQLPTMRC